MNEPIKEPLPSQPIMREVNRELRSMTSEERVEFFDYYASKYCRHCGDEMVEQRCNCWRDE